MFAQKIAALLITSLTFSAPPSAAPPAAAAPTSSIEIVVVREQAGAGAAQAQPRVDALVARLAKVAGWSQATGKYFGSLAAASGWMAAHTPDFVIASLPAALRLRAQSKLRILGEVSVSHLGGRQYFVVTTGKLTAPGGGDSLLAACRGKRLVSDHFGDAEFIEKVVAGGSFTLSDFVRVESRRPVQTLKMLIRGEAECALIDDAQKATMASLEGASELKYAWTSAELPALVFGALAADASTEKKLISVLPSVCADAGKPICEEAGLTAIEGRPSPRLTKILQVAH
jgi:hypothetical protein